MLWLILAIAVMPAYSSTCAVRCAAGTAAAGLAVSAQPGAPAPSHAGGCHDGGAPQDDPGSGSPAMAALCAFAGAAAISVAVPVAFEPAPLPFATLAPPSGESRLLQPPDPPPKAFRT